MSEYQVGDTVLCTTRITERYRKSKILEVCESSHLSSDSTFYRVSFYFWFFPCRAWVRENWIHGLVKKPLSRKELKKLDKLAKD